MVIIISIAALLISAVTFALIWMYIHIGSAALMAAILTVTDGMDLFNLIPLVIIVLVCFAGTYRLFSGITDTIKSGFILAKMKK